MIRSTAMALCALLCAGCFAPFGDPSKHVRVAHPYFGGYAAVVSDQYTCSGDCPTHFAGDYGIYAAVPRAHRGALSFEAFLVYKESRGANVFQLAATAGYQLWVHPRLWVRAGVGPFSMQMSDVTVDLEHTSAYGGVATGSIGTHFIEGNRLTMDLRLLGGAARTGAGSHVFGGLGIGLNWF